MGWFNHQPVFFWGTFPSYHFIPLIPQYWDALRSCDWDMRKKCDYWCMHKCTYKHMQCVYHVKILYIWTMYQPFFIVYTYFRRLSSTINFYIPQLSEYISIVALVPSYVNALVPSSWLKKHIVSSLTRVYETFDSILPFVMCSKIIWDWCDVASCVKQSLVWLRISFTFFPYRPRLLGDIHYQPSTRCFGWTAEIYLMLSIGVGSQRVQSRVESSWCG